MPGVSLGRTGDAIAAESNAESTAICNQRERRLGNRLLVAFLLVTVVLTFAWNARQAISIWSDRQNPGRDVAQLGTGTRRAPVPFDLSAATVPVSEIRSGGPPKDVIPALTNPRFIEGSDAEYLKATDRVVGVTIRGESRAYPLKVLNYHEVVNDWLADQPIAVTYCPLCDSVAVFDRRTPLGTREFGVSGLLYNSNVLMYDRAAAQESLWSQLKGEGVSGPAAQKRLRTLPVELATWRNWLDRHPETLVLSTDTGHPRNYDRNPYTKYFERPQLMLPVRPLSDRLKAKERVLGIWTDNTARAYPVSAFSEEKRRITDRIDGESVAIEVSPDTQTLRVAEAPPSAQWMYSFWFAWYAMRPDTEVYGGETGQ